MSYIQKVLADNPLGFWNLDTTTDLTGGGNDLVFNSTPTYTDILPINTSTYKDINTGEYIETKGLYVDRDTDVYITNEYNAFVKGTETLSFGIEFWFSIPTFTNERTNWNWQNFLYINDVNQPITAGLISRFDNIIKFMVSDGTTEYTVSKQIKSVESQIHVFALYSNRTISLFINGILGESLSLPPTFEFATEFVNKNDIHFQIPDNFWQLIMNSMAFYNQSLSQNQIRSHMLWGFNDSKPQSHVKQINAHYFEIKDDPGKFWYEKTFNDNASFSGGILNNLTIVDNGLSLQIPASLSTVDSKTKFSDLSKYFSLNNFSIAGTFLWDSILSNPEEILRIDGNDVSEFVYIAKNVDGSLGLYYTSSNDSDVLLLQTDITESTGNLNIFISIKNNFVSLYLEGAGSFSSNNFPNIFSATSSLYFNNYSSLINPLAENIKIFNTYIEPTSYYESTSSYDDKNIISLNNFDIIAKGTWTYSIPASTYYGIAGTKISWDSAVYVGENGDSNLHVEANLGNGWNKITNGGCIPNSHIVTALDNDIKIKITIYTIFNQWSVNLLQTQKYPPRIDNLYFGIYKNLSVVSDSNSYAITPYYNESASILHTYNLKSKDFNILSRSNNFGIKVNGNNTAVLLPIMPTAGFKTIEFWFRRDNINALNQNQYILSTNVTGEYLKFNAITSELTQNGFDKVYVNGLDLDTNPRTIIDDQPYHIVCIYSDFNFNNVFLNSDVDTSNSTTGTYGYITVYPDSLTSDDVKNRYLSYLTSFSEIVNESNSIGSILEYTGSATSYNDGNPIKSYQSASKQPII